MTRAGGLDLPGEVAGRVRSTGMVPGWDIADATGHDYACAAELVQVAYAFAQSAVAQITVGARGCSARR